MCDVSCVQHTILLVVFSIHMISGNTNDMTDSISKSTTISNKTTTDEVSTTDYTHVPSIREIYQKTMTVHDGYQSTDRGSFTKVTFPFTELVNTTSTDSQHVTFLKTSDYSNTDDDISTSALITPKVTSLLSSLFHEQTGISETDSPASMTPQTSSSISVDLTTLHEERHVTRTHEQRTSSIGIELEATSSIPMTSSVDVAIHDQLTSSSDVFWSPEQTTDAPVEEATQFSLQTSFKQMNGTWTSNEATYSSIRPTVSSTIMTLQVAVLIGAITGACIAILLPIFVIAFCVCRRKKRKSSSGDVKVRYRRNSDLSFDNQGSRFKWKQRPPSSPDGAFYAPLSLNGPPSAHVTSNNIFMNSFPSLERSLTELDSSNQNLSPVNNLYAKDSDEGSINEFAMSTFCAQNSSYKGRLGKMEN